LRSGCANAVQGVEDIVTIRVFLRVALAVAIGIPTTDACSAGRALRTSRTVFAIRAIFAGCTRRTSRTRWTSGAWGTSRPGFRCRSNNQSHGTGRVNRHILGAVPVGNIAKAHAIRNRNDLLLVGLIRNAELAVAEVVTPATRIRNVKVDDLRPQRLLFNTIDERDSTGRCGKCCCILAGREDRIKNFAITPPDKTARARSVRGIPHCQLHPIHVRWN
jgi:hypothetical protein